MIPMRQSSAEGPNTGLMNTEADQSTVKSISRKAPPPAGHATSNVQWLRDHKISRGIILLGGTSVAHFRLRVAQAQLRSDLLPSYWSMAGILLDEASFVSVPLDVLDDSSIVPMTNGVQTCKLSDYDDTTRYPNIAVLQFTEDNDPILDAIERVKLQRGIIDLPTLMLAWLGYIWGAGQQANPLLSGMGLPSAAFVETAHGMAGVELTPGLSSAASCPEAIWQSAKWWHDFYAGPRGVRNKAHAKGIVPKGVYAIRQPAAAAIGPKDEKVGELIVAREDRRMSNEESPGDETKATTTDDSGQTRAKAPRKSSKKSSAKKRGGKK